MSWIEHAQQGAGPQNLFAEEVLDLGLALTGERVFNLAAEGHQFVDLVHTQTVGQQAAALLFDFERGPARLAQRGFGVGTWFTIFVSAENANSLRTEARWSWDGTLDGLVITN